MWKEKLVIKKICSILRLLFIKKPRTIKVVIPKGWMNCSVTKDNHFIADTNDSNFWDTLKFPLPKPKYKWNIKCYTGNCDTPDKKAVILIDKH